MHKKVKQKISLCIFLKIWSFYSKVRNFSCFDILESIILFKAINILKNTLNMKKASSQHLLKMNRNIWMEKCKIIKKSARCIENLERLKGWVTLEAANGFEPETNEREANILNIYIYLYYMHLYVVISGNYILTTYLHLSAQYWKQRHFYYIVLLVYTRTNIETSKMYCFPLSMLIQPPDNYLPEYKNYLKCKKTKV